MSRTDTLDPSSPLTVMGEHLDLALTPQRSPRRRRSDALGWLLFAGLVLGVWQLTRLQLFTARSDTGYWLGVGGGTLMLLLFAYPLRKRWQVLARAGKAKHWFIVHMFLGIFGPLTILAHCTFRIGSVNAGVALFSMLVVALSGIAGRFFYLRVHRGLGGEIESFDLLRKALRLQPDEVHSELSFAPQVEARLRALESLARRPGSNWTEHAQSLVSLPLRLRRQRLRCQREAARRLEAVSAERGWSAAELARRQQRAQRLVADYIGAIQRVAQLAAYSRLFSLWHLLHVPFVVVMVMCAIAHVVAVHAY